MDTITTDPEATEETARLGKPKRRSRRRANAETPDLDALAEALDWECALADDSRAELVP